MNMYKYIKCCISITLFLIFRKRENTKNDSFKAFKHTDPELY